MRCALNSLTSVHVVVIIVVRLGPLPLLMLILLLVYFNQIVFLCTIWNYRLFPSGEDFFEFWNTVFSNTGGEFYIKFNNKSSFLERVSMQWHSFIHYTLNVIWFYYFTYKQKKKTKLEIALHSFLLTLVLCDDFGIGVSPNSHLFLFITFA